MYNEKQMSTTFQKNGSTLVKNILSKDICEFLTNVFLRMHHNNVLTGIRNSDNQVTGALVTLSSNPYNDTFLETVWPIAEKIAGEELIPTYSFARLYCNGNVLKPHIDRESCEVSITIQLAKSHNYIWPIYTEGTQYDLEVGDAMMYLGCEKSHWREECKGPNEYYSGQLFLHFVKANGKFKSFAGDRRWRKDMPFVRNRMKQSETNILS